MQMSKVKSSVSIINSLAAKQAVYHFIRSEIGFLLVPTIYPEVIEISKQLITHNTLSYDAVQNITTYMYKKAPEGHTKLSVPEMLRQNLFLVDHSSGTVSFQNRATANFVKDYFST